MSVYNKNGVEINALYAKSGSGIATAYGSDGEIVFPGIDPTDYNFKIMSFNNQSWTGLSGWSYIGAAILSYGCDIVGTQESHTTTYMTNAGYSYCEVSSTQSGNIVWSKQAVTDVTSASFTSNHYAGKRGYQKMKTTINGKTVAIYNTHLETSTMPQYQYAQVQELIDMLEDEEYFILTGDLNMDGHNQSDSQYLNVIKPFIDAGFNVANCSSRFGFNGTWTNGTTAAGPWNPCDNVITSSNIRLANFVVDMTKVELDTGLTIDHLPVIAYLKV